MTIQHTELKLRDILLLESAKSQCRPRPVGDLSQKASVCSPQPADSVTSLATLLLFDPDLH